MPQSAQEHTHQNNSTEIRTAKYVPDSPLKDEIRILKDRSVWWANSEELNNWLKESWTILAIELEKLTGIQLPPFNPESIRWAQFPRHTKGDIDPISGSIRLSEYLINPNEIVYTLAHEMVHFTSYRQILINKLHLLPLRVGISLLGKGVFQSDEKDLRLFQEPALNFLNEAITELVAVKILNRCANSIPGVSNFDFSPHAYQEAIDFYHALVTNIVLAWNNPKWRAYRTDRNALASQIGFPALISEIDVEIFLETVLWQKHRIRHFALLINFLFGNETFRNIFSLSSKIKSSSPKTELLAELYGLISMPVIQQAHEKRDVEVEIASGIKVIHKASDIPDGIPLLDYPTEHGTQYGIESIYKMIRHTFSTPLLVSDSDSLIDNYLDKRMRKVTQNKLLRDFSILSLDTNKVVDSDPAFSFAMSSINQIFLPSTNPSRERRIFRNQNAFIFSEYKSQNLPNVCLVSVSQNDRFSTTLTYVLSPESSELVFSENE